jgi:hypothetical protein
MVAPWRSGGFGWVVVVKAGGADPQLAACPAGQRVDERESQAVARGGAGTVSPAEAFDGVGYELGGWSLPFVVDGQDDPAWERVAGKAYLPGTVDRCVVDEVPQELVEVHVDQGQIAGWLRSWVNIAGLIDLDDSLGSVESGLAARGCSLECCSEIGDSR